LLGAQVPVLLRLRVRKLQRKISLRPKEKVEQNTTESCGIPAKSVLNAYRGSP
jgi:hypothetical protein